jgi:ADP-ribose pyrophosphatase
VKNPWKTLSSKTRYDNPWIEVVEHQVLKPSGRPGIYGTVHFKNRAIAIIPVADNGDTWLVGQFRYPLGAYSWEIPEGGGPLSEEPLAAARRELKEECGIVAKSWELILEMDLSNSTTDEKSYTYLARDLELGESEPEEEEDLQLRRLPLKHAVEMAARGEIRDALAVASLFKAARILGL